MHKREKKRAPDNVKSGSFFGHERLQRTSEEQFLVNGGKQDRRDHKQSVISVRQGNGVPRHGYAEKSVKAVRESVQHKRSESKYQKTADYSADISEPKQPKTEKLLDCAFRRKFFQQICRAREQHDSDKTDGYLFIGEL